MTASELRHALTYIDDDEEVEFFVDVKKGQGYSVEPTHAQITSRWTMAERGDLTPIPDTLPRTMTIHLEI